MEEFSYNARQYFDFNQEAEDITDDSYFEVDREEVLTQMAEITIKTTQSPDNGGPNTQEDSDPESESAFFSPMGAVSAKKAAAAPPTASVIRRSVSANDVTTMLDGNNGLAEGLQEDKNHQPKSKPGLSRSVHKSRAMSKDNINRLAQPKRYKSQEGLNRGEFKSMAECVNRFQVGTPQRFRTMAKPIVKATNHITEAHTPFLLTLRRARPTTALTSQQQAELSFEEAKKFKIKAHPVNQRILRGPMKVPAVEKKAPTTVEPFHLTEIKKKELDVEIPKVPVFHAQPVPKSLHKPFTLLKTAQVLTEARTPQFSKRLAKSPAPKVIVKQKSEENLKSAKPSNTHVQPFSFEKRDLELKKRRDAFVAKVLEEEKKKREFHAQPVPKSVLRSRNGSLNCIHDKNPEVTQMYVKQRSFDNIQPQTSGFKAKPATILKMKPFEPKKEPKVTKVEEFHFNTDDRIEAWQKYEENMKIKLEEAAEFKKRQEEQLRAMEEAEAARLRKLAEVRAQPIRKYKAVTIQPSNKVTNPVPFNFHTGNKENEIL